MKIKKIAFIFVLILMFSTVYGETTFSMPEINNDSGILFSVTHKHPGEISYNTLFSSDLEKDESTKQITSFPEQLSLLSEGKILRIRNRYGISQYSTEDKSLTHTSTVKDEYIPSNSVLRGAESVSPNGKWICSLEKTGTVSAKITIKNASGYTETVLVDSANLSYTSIPVKWSPDSSMLIYEKHGNIYFTEPEAMFQTNQIPEKLRKIGTGTIDSIYWASAKNLIYICGDLIYRIPLNEMYTRSLYSDFVGIGTIIGRLPYPFSITDKFSVNSDCTRMIHVRNNRTILYMKLPGNASFTEQLYTKTENANPAETINISTIWSRSTNPIVWIQLQRNGVYNCRGFRFIEDENSVKAENLSLPQNIEYALPSPDGRRIFFTDGKKSYIYNLQNLEKITEQDTGKILSCVWADSSSIYLGGTETVKRWFVSGNSQVLFPSSASQYSWNLSTNRPVVKADGALYEYDELKSVWEKSLLLEMPVSKSRNDKYRTFLGSSPNCEFTNAPYVRTLTGPAITKVMYTPASQPKNALPKVALVFDAIDNADGLAAILNTLNKYNIKATFFINGEFIRRYPAETIKITQAGHECGSMFYTVADLSDSNNFIMDEDFIRRGLARNEDEFFATTGHELSLIWHAPFYKASKQAINAGTLAGYNYVQRMSFPSDRVTMEKSAITGKKYYSSNQIIEYVIKRIKDKDVIPVSTGVYGGRRYEYLYDNLDMLIGAILDSGYEIVTAGSLSTPAQADANTYQQE